MHENSRLMYVKYALNHIPEGARVLEIGPDQFPSTYQRLSADRRDSWSTIDIHKNEKLTYTAESGYAFPIADDSYDVVISGQVLEHVPSPTETLRRVLRAAGFSLQRCPQLLAYIEFLNHAAKLPPHTFFGNYISIGV